MKDLPAVLDAVHQGNACLEVCPVQCIDVQEVSLRTLAIAARAEAPKGAR
jgi:Na+-translocating ferredoxin:NAD+ oxidoreductase RNF subunit RnfB